MQRLLMLYPHPDDPGHFRSYFVGTHLGLARKLPGILGYRYSFEVADGSEKPPYFAVFEADFADANALQAALTSPEGEAALADLPNYATGGSVPLMYPVTEPA
jgi:uncharacterized protein (TIGR02118 family)